VIGDGAARINLAGASGLPELARADGMKSGDLRKAMRIVAEHQG